MAPPAVRTLAMRTIAALKRELKAVEQAMRDLVKQHVTPAVRSSKGLGPVFQASMLALLVFFVIGVVVSMALWFAPALVVFRGLQPMDAMRTSIGAVLKNPYAGRYVEDILPLMDALSPLGLRLAQQLLQAALKDVPFDLDSALAALRERERDTGEHTLVLMVTAHAMTGDRERFMAAGADGYVSKPMSEAALRKEINRTCKPKA